MKNLFLFTIVVLGFAAASFGQNLVTVNDVTAGGTIITPITLTRVTNMEFGTITAATGGSVTLVPGGSASYSSAAAYTATGMIAPTTASFSVTGDASNSYAITVTGLPALVTHTTDNSATMAISDWTSNKLITVAGTGFTGTGALSGGGTDSFEIGAKLTLTNGAAQKSGRYTSAAFSVTVNYN